MDEEARAALDGHTPLVEVLAPARSVGRPNTFNQDIAKLVLDHVADGMSFRKIGRLDGFPGRTTLFRWCRENEEFAQDYAMALQWRTEGRIDQMVEIATDSRDDHVPKEINSETGETRLEFQKEAVSRSELGVKTLQWIVEREMPQKYAPFEHRQAGAPPPASQGASGDNAREINPRAPQVIEGDPLKGPLDACARAAKEPLPTTGQ